MPRTKRSRREENTDGQTLESQLSNMPDLLKMLEADVDYKRDLDERLNRIETLVIGLVASQKSLETVLKQVETGQKHNDELLKTSIGEIKSELKVITPKSSDERHGTIRFVFNIDDLQDTPNQKLLSNSVIVAGAKWYLWVMKKNNDNVDCLAVYLHCNRILDNVSYDTTFTTCLFGSRETVSRTAKYCYNKNIGNGWPLLATWAELSNYAKGFLDKGRNATVQVEFDLKVVTEMESTTIGEFPGSANIKPDCSLIVEGRRIGINKGFLSAYSSYFDVLFNGEFVERNQSEIELKDVLFTEVIHLLSAIYPSRKHEQITEMNIECLLRLADRFQVDIVTERCKDFLKECPVDRISLGERLMLAQDYRLVELMSSCVKQVKTGADMKKLVSTREYDMLRADTKVSLLENIARNS